MQAKNTQYDASKEEGSNNNSQTPSDYQGAWGDEIPDFLQPSKPAVPNETKTNKKVKGKGKNKKGKNKKKVANKNEKPPVMVS